jgi:hypothetical protein
MRAAVMGVGVIPTNRPTLGRFRWRKVSVVADRDGLRSQTRIGIST